MSEEQEVIIIAEDSAPNQKILTHLLRKLNYHVEAVADGQEAWALLERLKGRKELVCVVSDIMMPKMDGIELLKKIRSSTDFAQLPVILVTAVSDKNSILEAKNHHVNGYILKPVTLDKIEKKLKELFPGRAFPRQAS